MKKKELANTGITLIALVVTIIVLLILAGISIMMLTGDNGILQRAASSKVNVDNSQIQERINLAYHSALINGQGDITEDLLEKDLSNEFGFRNIAYTLINSKDGKSWIVSINGTNVKETILKPSKLQTEPINPEVEYGYAEKPGVVDASSLVEGDIINYYYDKDKKPISCAVLYNDNVHGLQVVTLDSIKNITLGYDDTVKDPKADIAFENNAPSGYTNYVDSTDLLFEKARWSYNHTFQTLKEYAMDYIGNMAITAKCIGSPDNLLLEENQNVNMFSVNDDYKWFSNYNGKYKNGDKFDLGDELNKMTSLGILKTKTPCNYWISSRNINANTKNIIKFNINIVDSNEETVKKIGLLGYASQNGISISRKATRGGVYGFRPIFILRDDIQVEKTNT